MKSEYFDIESYTPISTNKYYSGMHWAKRKAIADQWHYIVKEQLKAFKVSKFIASVELYFSWDIKSRFDLDNHAIMRKMIIDSLVSAGVIAGDSKKYIKHISECFHSLDNIRVEIREI
jgi:Holliday junction resolvase RusA-like endonuclease